MAGVDEAGRGPLAGPVTVAAVVLDPANPIEGLDDSKRLTTRRREALFSTIQARAVCWSIIHVEPATIDELNILQATLQGMREAVLALDDAPDRVEIDGNCVPENLPCPARAIVGGDGQVAAISSASILAKVSRDRLMAAAHRAFPQYGFEGHKGYPTPQHLKALETHGPCVLHRRSFAPVRRVCDQLRLAL